MNKISSLLSTVILTAGLLISCSSNSSYKQVKIGNNIWMAENLNFEQFQNGDAIPQVKTNKEWLAAAEAGTPVWCYYEFDPANEAEFGKIYNLHAINDTRGLAPKGWRMPILNEWSELKSLGNLEFFVAKKADEIGAFFNDFYEVSQVYEQQLHEQELIEDVSFLDDLNEDDLSTSDSDSSDTTSNDMSLDNLNEEDETVRNATDFVRLFMPNIDANNTYSSSPQLGFAKAQDTARINQIIKAHAEIYMTENIRFIWSAKETRFNGNSAPYYTLYAFEVPYGGYARVGGYHIANARVSVDPDNGDVGVTVNMTSSGAREWGDMTEENVGNFIAITMENKVLSAPVIIGPIREGSTLISGGFTKNEAKELALILNAGGNQAHGLIIHEGGRVFFSATPWYEYANLGVGDATLYNGNAANGYAIRCIKEKVTGK